MTPGLFALLGAIANENENCFVRSTAVLAKFYFDSVEEDFLQEVFVVVDFGTVRDDLLNNRKLELSPKTKNVLRFID